VVTLLNRFFDVVIDVVHAHSGFINKFEGMRRSPCGGGVRGGRGALVRADADGGAGAE
jgi:hypothetical protein